MCTGQNTWPGRTIGGPGPGEGQRGLELWQLLYENEVRRGNREASEANARARYRTVMMWTVVDGRENSDPVARYSV